MKRRFLKVILSILATQALTGCVLLTKGPALDVPGYELPAPRPFVDSFRAGVGKADITPPAGFPTGGHGPSGSMARGAWTRLYARAFVFADEQGNVAVFVSCDLFAIPGGLTARVAHDVGLEWKKKKGITIRPEAITLAATHTHQSPGNFLTAAAYNEAASKYSGFSKDLFDFLQRQIVSAINSAIKDALEHGTADLHVLEGTADLDQLNRSPRTFMLNADALPVMDALHPPPTECEPVHETGEARRDFKLHDCPRRRAADPALTVLKITRNNELVGAMIFYAGHPTVLDPPAPIYSGDFTGVAMSELERKLSSSSTPVFGFFNGAEGDIVVRRGVRDVREVFAVGNAFAKQVQELLSPSTKIVRLAPVITVRGAALNTRLDEDRVCGKSSLAKKPLMGAPALGGAEDDRTVFYGLGYRKGRLGIADKGQGGKLGAFDSHIIPGLRLTHIVAPPRKFPRELPLRYVKIGNFVMATVPGEFSTMAGRRLVDRLRGESDANGHVVLVGLANEYTGYVTTAEEYAAQDYMAASTLWGPGEAEVFTCRLERLKAESLDATPAPAEPIVIEEKRYFPGHPPQKYDRKMRFGPRGVGEKRSAADEELGEILLDHRGVPARGLPIVFWPEPVADEEKEEFEAATRRKVSIRRVGETMGRSVSPGADGLPRPEVIEDDSGTGFVTLVRKAPSRKDKERKMAAIWLRPILDDDFAEGLYQFRIEFTDGKGMLTICDADPFRASRESATRPNVPQKATCRPASAEARKR